MYCVSLSFPLNWSVLCQQASSAHCASLSQGLMTVPINTFYRKYCVWRFCAWARTTIMTKCSHYINATERCCRVRQGATSESLAGHLPQPHLRTTSDKQLIRQPLAVVVTLCGICRSDGITWSGISFNWTEQKQISGHFCSQREADLFIQKLLIW